MPAPLGGLAGIILFRSAAAVRSYPWLVSARLGSLNLAWGVVRGTWSVLGLEASACAGPATAVCSPDASRRRRRIWSSPRWQIRGRPGRVRVQRLPAVLHGRCVGVIPSAPGSVLSSGRTLGVPAFGFDLDGVWLGQGLWLPGLWRGLLWRLSCRFLPVDGAPPARVAGFRQREGELEGMAYCPRLRG